MLGLLGGAALDDERSLVDLGGDRGTEAFLQRPNEARPAHRVVDEVVLRGGQVGLPVALLGGPDCIAFTSS